MVEIIRAGEIFGEMGVIDGSARSATATVEGRVRLLRIGKTHFMEALRTSPLVGIDLCLMMASRLRRTFELFQDATFETLEVRLARQVLYLAEREGKTTPDGVRLSNRLRQGDLADLLGATTRSIITILNAWRAAELVSYDTDKALLTIKDLTALRSVAESGR